MIDHVIIGHGIPIGRNEEAGALAHYGLLALAHSLRHPRHAELLKKFLHSGRDLIGTVALSRVHTRRISRLLDLDAHRDDGWFNLRYEVSESRWRVFGVGGVSRRCPRWKAERAIARWPGDNHSETKASGRCKERQTPGGKAFFIVGFEKICSIHGVISIEN
jgi:hypothetical protein